MIARAGPAFRRAAARVSLAAVLLLPAGAAEAQEPPGLHAALDRLAREGRFSGAVVVRGARGERFARGYGHADPFARRPFTPATLVDSASLAKPVTAAAVLLLAREGRLDLDAPVIRYLPEYPHRATTVRHLLIHSAGLDGDQSETALAGRTNAQLLAGIARRREPPAFAPGSRFSYCNFCYVALALLVERVAGTFYLDIVRDRLEVPRDAALRPARLADWSGRAIGYRRLPDGTLERADSYEDEIFYGAANLSISAAGLARWGAEWWQPRLAPLRPLVTAPALIAGHVPGLSQGNWYCAPDRRRCHYLGHHEGFHHMLYWDADRRISVAMVSNNSLAPALQQRLQRAIVAFVEGRGRDGRHELESPLPDVDAAPGDYRLGTGERVTVRAEGERRWLVRRGLAYPAFPIGAGIRYVPGLDAYLAAGPSGRVRLLGLYEDLTGTVLANPDCPPLAGAVAVTGAPRLSRIVLKSSV